MMTYLKNKILLLLSISMLTNTIAHASDFIPKDTKLKQDSYVFTVEEAKELKLYIEELQTDSKLLDEYIKLDEKNQQELELKDKQIESIEARTEILENQIKRQERYKKLSPVGYVTSFVLGIGLSVGAVYLVKDKSQSQSPTVGMRIQF